jgi:hypothetical protein
MKQLNRGEDERRTLRERGIFYSHLRTGMRARGRAAIEFSASV